jgi:hypothetical protein
LPLSYNPCGIIIIIIVVFFFVITTKGAENEIE